MNNNNVIHKRMMVDPHRIKCRRAIVICKNSDEANLLVQHVSQTTVMNRSVCAVVIQDLLSDLCLFEKQVIQFGDTRHQQQLLYVSDLSRCRGPSGLVKFLKEKFSSFGTILSVLICSEDDGYAVPEGVIKFAYLSEAFAAELAFDQYVIGKERLSVTSHHNILLSQCDLRVRLRDAHRRNSNEYSTLGKSPFECCNHSYEQNDLSTTTVGSQQQCNSHDPVVNSMKNLKICHTNDDLITTESDLPDGETEVSLPAFSQYTFKLNLPNEQANKSTFSHMSHQNAENTTCVIPVSDSDLNKSKNIDNTNSHSNHEMPIHISETIPLDVDSTKNMSNLLKESFSHVFSKKCLNSEVLPSHNKKSPGNKSDCDSFITCDTFPETHSSSKNTLYNNNDINSISEYKSVSDCKEIPSSLCDSLNASKVVKDKLVIKSSKKKRKKFNPSQKLCLKSQRTALSQSDAQSTTARSEITVSSSSQPENPTKKNKLTANKVSLLTVSPDSSGSFKVAKWLSNFPDVQNTENTSGERGVPPDSSRSLKLANWLSSVSDVQNTENTSGEREVPPDSSRSLKVANWLSNVSDVQNTESTSGEREENMEIEQKTLKHNRISVYRAPSIKSNLILPADHRISISDDSSVENEDPNINLTLTDKREPAMLTDEFKSPLQTWLKAEILSSTNNAVFRSEETLKSFIICATGTKDVIINVGCSYMTCEACYPQSTDLLLGYK